MAATGENDFSAMLFCDAAGEGKTEARSFLLSLTHKWFEEAIANTFWNSEAIIDDIDDYILLLGIERFEQRTKREIVSALDQQETQP